MNQTCRPRKNVCSFALLLISPLSKLQDATLTIDENINAVNLAEHKMSRNVRKRTFGHVRTATIHISLSIHAVLPEYSLNALWIPNDADFLHAYNVDCGQT